MCSREPKTDEPISVISVQRCTRRFLAFLCKNLLQIPTVDLYTFVHFSASYLHCTEHAFGLLHSFLGCSVHFYGSVILIILESCPPLNTNTQGYSNHLGVHHFNCLRTPNMVVNDSIFEVKKNSPSLILRHFRMLDIINSFIVHGHSPAQSIFEPNKQIPSFLFWLLNCAAIGLS